MKALVFGSCNLDFIYPVPRPVPPEELKGAKPAQISPGGKGVNQAIALKKAGLDAYFAGKHGADGVLLRETLVKSGVDVSFLRQSAGISGQAHIQVTPDGENYILLLLPGANREITREEIDETLSHFGAGDLLVLQNEVSELPYMIEAGFARGMRVVMNPSPFSEAMTGLDYAKIWLVFVNETEAQGLCRGAKPEDLIAEMRLRYPGLRWVVTLGENGSLYFDRDTFCRQSAFPATAIDTTCAGDTFTGYFTAALCRGLSPAEALRRASAASAITVSRMGAAGVIPTAAEVDALIADS